jgi:hypothetical protein
VRDVDEVRGASDPVDQGHPEEHDRGRQDAEQEELHRGLVRSRVLLAEPGDEEPGRAHELERDEQHQQITRRRHEHHAEEAREEQEVELALARPDGLVEVVHGDQDDDDRHRHEQELEQQRVPVEHEHPPERRTPLPHQREKGHDRSHDAGRREHAVPCLEAVRQEQIDEQDEQDRARQNDLRERGVQIDRAHVR